MDFENRREARGLFCGGREIVLLFLLVQHRSFSSSGLRIFLFNSVWIAKLVSRRRSSSMSLMFTATFSVRVGRTSSNVSFSCTKRISCPPCSSKWKISSIQQEEQHWSKNKPFKHRSKSKKTVMAIRWFACLRQERCGSLLFVGVSSRWRRWGFHWFGVILGKSPDDWRTGSGESGDFVYRRMSFGTVITRDEILDLGFVEWILESVDLRMSDRTGFAEIRSRRRGLLSGTVSQSRSAESRSRDAVLVDCSTSILLDSRQCQWEILLRWTHLCGSSTHRCSTSSTRRTRLGSTSVSLLRSWSLSSS